MLSIRSSLALLLVLTLVVAAVLQSPVLAAQDPSPQQRHVVTGAEMDAALARGAAAEEEDREAIRELFRHQHVQQIAASLGLEIKTAEAAVATLDGERLAQLADGARAADAALSGGQSITITYTAIIIILLLVILLVVLL